jgi:transposase-like protein
MDPNAPVRAISCGSLVEVNKDEPEAEPHQDCGWCAGIDVGPVHPNPLAEVDQRVAQSELSGAFSLPAPGIVTPADLEVRLFFGYQGVEVLKRYQKSGFHLKKLLRLLDQAPDQGEPVDDDPPSVQAAQRQVQRRLNPAERSDLIRLYLAGATTIGLARQFGVHKNTVRAAVDAAGVRRKKRRQFTASDTEQARLLYESGASMRSLGQRFGVSPERVKRHLARAGVSLRSV